MNSRACQGSVISRVQKLRKKAGLALTDDVAMEYEVLMDPENEEIDEALWVMPMLCVRRLEVLFRGQLLRGKNGVILEDEQEVQRRYVSA